MHRSRLCGFIIDCQTDDLAQAGGFWSRALGLETARSDDPADASYIVLRTGRTDLTLEVQRVDHASRVHLDIETDDVEAEVERLEGLGARRVERVRDWWVMEGPSGHRFCVVPADSADFAQQSNVWE